MKIFRYLPYRRKLSKWIDGMKEAIHDLIFQTSCPMVLPCAQKGEWPTNEQDIIHCRLPLWLPAELSAMIWSRQLS